MAVSATITMSSTGSGLNVTGSKAYSGGGRSTLDTTVADSVSDQLAVISIDVSVIQSIIILSTQNLTLETNSGGSPIDTIALKANVPYVWNTDQYFTNTLDTDVTAMYLTNASGSSADFKLECIYDDTP